MWCVFLMRRALLPFHAECNAMCPQAVKHRVAQDACVVDHFVYVVIDAQSGFELRSKHVR